MRIRFQGLEVGHVGDTPGPVVIEEVDWSYTDIRTNDWELEGRDGSLPGRDFHGARIVTFDLVTNQDRMVDARETAGEFLQAWRSKAHRDSSGVVVPLEYQVDDDHRWRRVYGRPRRSDDPDFGLLMRRGFGRMTCEFEVLNPLVFSGGDAFEATLNKFPDASVGGWVAPFVFPLTSEAVAGSREGFFAVGGSDPTPATVTFCGPGSSFSLDGNRGWHVGLKPGVSLAYDECLEIDPLMGTVQSYFTDNPGRRFDRFGALDRRTTLSEVRLQPGAENVFFSAIDSTNTSSALVQWREAFSTLA